LTSQDVGTFQLNAAGNNLGGAPNAADPLQYFWSGNGDQ
jgi:hypothetical protein